MNFDIGHQWGDGDRGTTKSEARLQYRPSDRKVGVMLFTLFMIAGMTITFLGAFFRGPGYAWTMPWEGFFFAL